MIDWAEYSIEEIKTGTDEAGNRLILSFCKNYKEVFGKDSDCCHQCPSFPSKVKKLISKINTMETAKNSGFKLKPMYQGIQPRFGADPVSDANLTDKRAIDLIENHPKGKDLFSELPENLDEVIKNAGNNETSFEGIIKKLKKAQLVSLAEKLELDSSGNAAELKERIIANGEVENINDLLKEDGE